MNYFNTKLHNTTAKREVMSGICTFISMSYILTLNPVMLSAVGMSYDGVFIASIVASIIVTLYGAFYAKMPLVYAPSVSYSLLFLPILARKAGGDWQLLMLATYLAGVVLVFLGMTGVYERVNKSIPEFVKYSMIGAVGMAIMIIGVRTLHIVEEMNGGWSIHIRQKEAAYCLCALGIMYWLKKRKKRYAVIEAIIITYAVVITGQLGIKIYNNDVSLSGIIGGYAGALEGISDFFKITYRFTSHGEFAKDAGMLSKLIMLTASMSVALFFDAYATGTALLDEIKTDDVNFNPDSYRRSMIVNGVGAMVGGCMGASAVTIYGENMVGIDTGAKTGLSAVVICICLGLSVFLAPFYKMMSGYVVAPAMIYVGYMFIRKIYQARFLTKCEKASGLFILLYGGLTFEFGYAAVWGMLLHIVLQLAAGKRGEITGRWPIILLLSCLCGMLKWYSC